MNAKPILASLVSPLGVERFLNEYWPERSFVGHGPLTRFPAAFRADILQDARTLTSQYRGKLTFGNSHAGSRTLNLENARSDILLHMGLSLYLVELPRMVPSLGNVLKQLELELGAPAGCARVGAFVAAAGGGVTCHFDSEEVFSIQLAGEKRWRIGKSQIEYPWAVQFNPGDPLLDEELYTIAAQGFPQPDTGSMEEVEMKPGSVLFLPRGTWHQTEAGDESLSLSIMVRTPPAAETMIDALRLRMLQDPRWRRPLFGAWGNQEQNREAQERWRELLGEVSAVAEGLSMDNALLSPLGEVERLERLNFRSRVQRRPEARMVLNARGERVEIFCRDKAGAEQCYVQLEVPANMRTLFEWLSDARQAFSAEETAARFPELPLEQHLRIIQALIRGQYLKQLWFDPPLSAH